MDTLRTHIGGHHGFRAGELCLTEVSSLIMRAGRVAGLVVKGEVRVAGHTGSVAVNGEMDYGWYCPSTGRWLVGWELDGRDVGAGHIAGTHQRLGNARKFAVSSAALKIQVLYSLKNSLLPWGGSQASRCRQLLGGGVSVISDEDLMAKGGIEGYVNQARRQAGLADLPY